MDFPICPTWFLGFDAIFELAFAIVAFTIALFAYKVYRYSGVKQGRLFAASFTFLGIAYVLQSLFNMLTWRNAHEQLCSALRISSVAIFQDIMIYSFFLFLILGLVTLFYVTMKTKRQRLYWLLVALSFATIILSPHPLVASYLVALIFYLWIFLHFVQNYSRKHKRGSLLVMFAFGLFVLSATQFLFGKTGGILYVLAHIFQLGGYVLLLVNFYVMKK
ncbi:MAG: hypothetical protein H6502_04395 [Candidatus Woesearchaeota archaeon]|nr:MAG: hypothetical protein H6502_04395 [Candidatus Woesearchaeota archaeon]